MINNTLIMNNSVNLAKKQLEKHAKNGQNSNLSIFEVAQLMDTIRGYSEIKEDNQNRIDFGFSNN